MSKVAWCPECTLINNSKYWGNKRGGQWGNDSAKKKKHIHIHILHRPFPNVLRQRLHKRAAVMENQAKQLPPVSDSTRHARLVLVCYNTMSRCKRRICATGEYNTRTCCRWPTDSGHGGAKVVEKRLGVAGLARFGLVEGERTNTTKQ